MADATELGRRLYEALKANDDGAYLSPQVDDYKSITVDGRFDLAAVASQLVGSIMRPEFNGVIELAQPVEINGVLYPAGKYRVEP